MKRIRIMPRFKEEDRNQLKGETRRALLEAAALEFAREGYNGANINRISTAAGYAKGTIYNYFESTRSCMP
jgi:AcrR family transcriptional regulator